MLAPQVWKRLYNMERARYTGAASSPNTVMHPLGGLWPWGAGGTGANPAHWWTRATFITTVSIAILTTCFSHFITCCHLNTASLFFRTTTVPVTSSSSERSMPMTSHSSSSCSIAPPMTSSHKRRRKPSLPMTSSLLSHSKEISSEAEISCSTSISNVCSEATCSDVQRVTSINDDDCGGCDNLIKDLTFEQEVTSLLQHCKVTSALHHQATT